MADDGSGATRIALRRAGEYVAAALRRASPSAEIASAWHSYQRGDKYFIRNQRISAWATATNARHPFYGHWIASDKTETNWAQPGRTNWDDKALIRAADIAVQRFGDEWIRDIVATSDFWSEG
jgi:hypothetical protein